jgi:predicted DNA-binding transcriptional regulator YafY
MSKKQFVKRYSLVINCLRKAPATFEEIQKFLSIQSDIDEEKYTMSKRTLQRDINEIASLYDIEIASNRSTKNYEIIEDENDDRNERLMESFEIFSALNWSKNLKNHLIVEKRRPLGTEHMHGLLHAIKNQFQVQCNYEKYWDSQGVKSQRTLLPLALKEARNRWYLIAQDLVDAVVKTFGLDRISNLELSHTKFKYPSEYDIDEQFKDAFGIISTEKEAQKVVLELSIAQANYIKSLPLHHSQKIISENESTCTIQLYLRPTYDFVMELMSMGKEVKVIEPQKLQEEIIAKLKANLNSYL